MKAYRLKLKRKSRMNAFLQKKKSRTKKFLQKKR